MGLYLNGVVTQNRWFYQWRLHENEVLPKIMRKNIFCSWQIGEFWKFEIYKKKYTGKNNETLGFFFTCSVFYFYTS